MKQEEKRENFLLIFNLQEFLLNIFSYKKVKLKIMN